MCILCDNPEIDSNTILLDCSNCKKIVSLPSNLPNLKFLVIYGTNISTVPEYPALEGLYIMNCPIESLPDFPKLKKLNASNSKLLSVPDTYFRLEYLLIDNTPIQLLPETLISIKQISANSCKSLTEISSKLINLETLSINNTAIEIIPSLMSLNYIDIGSTNISVLPLNNLKCLRKVFAKGCNLSNPFDIIERGIDLSN